MNDNIPIKSISNKSNYYRDDNTTRSASNTSGTRNFKKIMDKDKDSGDEEERDKVAENDVTDEPVVDLALARTQWGKAKKTNLSLFELPAENAGKYGRQATESELIADSKESAKSTLEDIVRAEGALKGGKLEASTSLNAPVTDASLKKASLHHPSEDISLIPRKEKSESPVNLFAKLSKPNDNVALTKKSEEFAHEELAFETSPITKKDNIPNPFPRETTDLAAVNPQGYVESTTVVKVEPLAAVERPVAPAPSQSLQILVERMLKEMSVMTTGDKTETTVVIRHPPIFDGAQLSITGFDSAKGELNIRFANLTPPAQQLLQNEQQNLLAALEAKGYYVHIFTASTYTEAPRVVVADQPPTRDQGGQQQSKDGQPQKDRREEEA